MSENHRGPEVPEVRVPVMKRLDGIARITLEELATTHSVKNGTFQMLAVQDEEWLSVWEKFSFADLQADEKSTKRSKTIDDRSVVAILKKHELHDRSGKPVVY